MKHTYRSRCHVDGCDDRFIGITRSDYLEHLRSAHSERMAEAYDKVVMRQCHGCGTVYKTEDGACPSCGGRGVLQDGIVEGMANGE